MPLTFSAASTVPRRVSILAAIVALAGSPGCFHVSQRAWDNGRAMSSSMQYRDVLSGRRDPATMRAMYYTSTLLPSAQRSIRYPAFGHW